MKLIIALLIASFLLFAGCAAPEEAGDNRTSGKANATVTTVNKTPDTSPVVPVSENRTIIEAPSGPGSDTTTGSGVTATSQQDCATLTPDCKSCLAKKGCGWCKSSNSCFLGDSSGPSVSSCPSDKWIVTESGCSIVEDGSECSKITNCASCLSGTGCQWCIQGSKCASASSAEDCFGGWLTKSYQCNYASR